MGDKIRKIIVTFLFTCLILPAMSLDALSEKDIRAACNNFKSGPAAAVCCAYMDCDREDLPSLLRDIMNCSEFEETSRQKAWRNIEDIARRREKIMREMITTAQEYHDLDHEIQDCWKEHDDTHNARAVRDECYALIDRHFNDLKPMDPTGSYFMYYPYYAMRDWVVPEERRRDLRTALNELGRCEARLTDTETYHRCWSLNQRRSSQIHPDSAHLRYHNLKRELNETRTQLAQWGDIGQHSYFHPMFDRNSNESTVEVFTTVEEYLRDATSVQIMRLIHITGDMNSVNTPCNPSSWKHYIRYTLE